MLNKTSTHPLPDIFVGKDVINQRVKRFLKDKHPLLSHALSSSGTPRQETRSIWYSKEHVRTWLDEMDLMGADGLRVYFGVYGEDEGSAAGQTCLLMVLTRAAAGGNDHQDIILENEPGFEDRKNASRKRSAGDALSNDIINVISTPREYNYGSPCPPICPGSGSTFPQD
jgi:hypothetical protein